MKNKIAIRLVLVILLVVIVAFSGCIVEETPTEHSGWTEDEWIEEETIPGVDVIPISGVGQDITISSDMPVKLVVSGTDNVVTVPNDVTVIEIVMSGVDNIVYISRSANPQVEISGVENEVVRYETLPLPEQPVVAPTQPTIPIPNTQDIVGNYKVQDVSGDIISIVGNYNEIRILNADVSLIRVTGNYNTVYYPKEARPAIQEIGNENEITTY
jgi:hypothetical protein